MATHDEPGLRRLAWWLLAAGIALSMLLSAPALLTLGIPYDAPYGPPVAKIHPGSYLMMLAWGVALASHGNPVGTLLRLPALEPLVSAYFASMVLLFTWVVWQQGTSGAAYIVQSLWMPAIAVYTLRMLPLARGRQLLVLVMSLLVLNAVLALAEYFLKARLVPIAAEQVGDGYFRSSALLGHPLLNANITTALLPAVTLLPVRKAWRLAAGVLLLVSVLAFGARSALVATVGVVGLCGSVHVAHRVVRGRYGYLALTGGAVAVGLALCSLALLVMATGLGDRIFHNLAWDNSASVRTRAWEAFDYLHGMDWWLGVPPLRIEDIELRMGLDPKFETIENFWIYGFLQFGAIGYLPFVGGLACLTVWMFRQSTPALRIGIVLFYLVASTANALTSKTVSLTLLATVVAASLAPRRPATALPRLRMRPVRWRAAALR